MRTTLWYTATLAACFLAAGNADGQSTPRIGIRGGVGTDINLGLAYGVGINYAVGVRNPVELGVVLFGGRFKEDTEEGSHVYNEKTDLMVYGMMANYLLGYAPGQRSLYFVAGVGVAGISAEWEERSDTDDSLGPPLPGGGSMTSEDGTAAGTVLNLGIGANLSDRFDMRVELPTIVTFAPPGGASSVVPTLIATLGLRF
jgi:opacity protein-like surface antigen